MSHLRLSISCQKGIHCPNVCVCAHCSNDREGRIIEHYWKAYELSWKLPRASLQYPAKFTTRTLLHSSTTLAAPELPELQDFMLSASSSIMFSIVFVIFIYLFMRNHSFLFAKKKIKIQTLYVLYMNQTFPFKFFECM